jgi:transposase-like protein
MTMINAARFRNEDAAREHLENIRWPDGAVCPHCGGTERNSKLRGESHRSGLYFCGDCREQFSVTVGTVFESSKVPLSKWLLAVHLMCSSKKGISSHQIHRTLGVTYKTAWFMTHRIRHAMTVEGGLMGSGGGVVEADETYIGRKPGRSMRRGAGHKHMVFTLVERGGRARSVHITGKAFAGIKKALKGVSPDARLATDDARMYRKIAQQFAEHLTVNHSANQYRDGDASTNTIEGFFSVFKRGMTGVYQHCSSDHLHRYLTEFDFHYNNRTALECDDAERTRRALGGIGGKRLTYHRPD